MQRTRLIQRLTAPVNSIPGKIKPHHVFGGGNLGLTQEAWELLDPIFTIDYMGAAEYEFGTIPQVLNDLIRDHEQLIAFSFIIKAKYIKADFSREMAYRTQRRKELADAKARGEKAKRAKPVHAENDAVIYVLCRKQHKDEVEQVIRELAKDKVYTKESSLFLDALGKSLMKDLGGWLELDNGFFFFIDEQMWKGTCDLFLRKSA